MTLRESELQQLEHLLIVEDKRGKRTIVLEAATYSIGRDPNNSIVLNSNLVSRQHAILLRVTNPDNADYLFRVIDGNLQGRRSKNGLIINGRRCFSHDLKHGDVIRFGGEVTARYYTTANLLDVELLATGKVEDVIVARFNSTIHEQPFVKPDAIKLETSHEAALVRLASFPELISHPILEINLTGSITYLNPAAIAQFPSLKETKLQHPILAGLVEAVATCEQKCFVREVTVGHQVFEQSVHYIAESDLIRSYVVDITKRKQVEVLLQQTQAELEVRVERRTAALRKANEQLTGEILERQRAEEEVRFLQTMTQAISESADFHSALGVALAKICEFTNWKFGEAWIPAADGKNLEYSPAWYGNYPNAEEFRQASEQFQFTPATGLPGRVWSSKCPEWIQDVSNVPENVFLRKQSAIAVGLKAGLGIPIIDKNQVLAVLVFFLFESCEEDQRLVQIVSTVATQLGSLIQRKRAEEALRESEEHFRFLVEGVKDYAIFMLDPDGKIVTWNAGAERIKGYRSDEIIGAHFSCFYPQADITSGKPEQQLRLCQLQGQIEDEGWRVRKNGSKIWVSVVISALQDKDGKLCGFSHVTRDITECKQTEEALRQSEERLQAILDNSTALIYVKDLQGKYILINSWFGIIFNLNREEIIGKTDYEIFPQEIADVMWANDQKVISAKSPLDWEEVAPQADGLHTYLSVKFPLYNSAGVPYAVCGISTDITERKQVEDALHSSLATNRALLNAIPDWMFRINKDGIFVNCKAAKDNNLPVLEKDFLGKNLNQVLPPEVAQPMMDCVEQALFTHDVQIFEYQLMVNQNLLDYEARIAMSAEDEVMAIVRDITERKRVEADVRTALEKEKQLSELKTRFISMASHEFRTPLATILSSAELLEHYSHKWNEEKKLKHLQRIQASVKHMTGLLNDVLLIGKAEAGKLEFNPTQVDISQFCADLVEEVQLTTSSHTIIFRNQSKCINNCFIDEKLLRHIISNLLSNAIKYSPAGGTVYFDFICQPGEAIFRIQDQGIGIPVKDQAQLFSSFHRASNVGTISGTGLGLAIVKKSVDLHGGRILVESAVGVGTTFTVIIPLSLTALDKTN